MKKEPGEADHNKNGALRFKRGQYRVLRIDDDWFKDYLYNLFSGIVKKPGEGAIYLDDVDIIANPCRKDFIFFCRPGRIPGDIRAVDFLSLIMCLMDLSNGEKQAVYNRLDMESLKGKRFGKLPRVQKFEILLSLMAVSKSRLYLVHDLSKRLPIDAFIRMKKTFEELAAQGAAVVFLTEDYAISDRRSYNDSKYWDSTKSWTTMVEEAEQMENRNQPYH